MKLQTQLPIKKEKNTIDYTSALFLMGSCFVENIGEKLSYYKFDNLQNPFGIVFHPLAIEQLVFRAVNKQTYTSKDVFYYNERWHCFDAHSNLSDVTEQGLLAKLNTSLESTFIQLQKISHIILTLGTSWVYRHKSSNKIVANCHKVSQKEFSKELLSVSTICKSLENCIRLIQSINPKAEIIITVSPVRHLKDGFVENQLSKAHLLTAIHEILKQGDVLYFPSYEIMMDELRDYRFYKEDMVHPSALAVDYIWEKFMASWIAENALETMRKVAVVQNGLAHRPFNEVSLEHQKFLKNLKKKKQYLEDEFSFMKF